MGGGVVVAEPVVDVTSPWPRAAVRRRRQGQSGSATKGDGVAEPIFDVTSPLPRATFWCS